MSAVLCPTFGPLLETDSLVARIDAIWNRKPAKRQDITVSVGHTHPDDDAITEWEPLAVDRNTAARMLRYARRNGLLIEQSVTGWSISE